MHDGDHPLAFLVGTWRGRGAGHYPTIDDFTYEEELTVADVGRPFLTYGQRTWHPDHGRPMHAETGYLRCPEPGRVELVLAHPTGIVEVEEGTVDGRTIELATTQIVGSSSAKEVTALTRSFVVDGDTLTYDVWMAAVGIERTHHLAATLRRT